ncbi:hypothetical protein GCM10027284_46380 [Cyclobacterium sediminis]
MKKRNRPTSYIICFLLGTLLFFHQGEIFASDSLRQKKFEHPYLEEAELLASNGLVAKALEVYKEAYRLFFIEKNYEGQVISACRSAAILTGQWQIKEAEEFILKAETSLQQLPHNERLEGQIFYRYGLLYDYKNMPDSALIFYNKSLDIMKKSFGIKSNQVGYCYNAIGDVYRYGYLNYLHAEKYYKMAMHIRESEILLDPQTDVAEIYYNLATTYRLKGDTEKAETYATKANIEYKKEKNYLFISLCESLLANLFIDKNDLSNAIAHYKRAIRLMKMEPKYSSQYLPDYYIGASLAYQKMGELDESYKYLDLARRITEDETSNSLKLAEVLINFGALNHTNKPDRADDYFNTGIQINEKILGKENPITANSYLEYGRHLVGVKDYSLGKVYIQKALKIKGITNLINKDSEKSFLDGEVKGVLEGLSLLGICDFQLYTQTSDFKYLEQAWESYLYFDQILTLFRNSMLRENSRLELASAYKSVYEQALNCAIELFEIMPSNKISNEIFRIIEKSKSLVLIDYLHKTEINNFLGIPDSLVLEEHNLETQIKFFTRQIDNSTNIREIESFQNKLFYSERRLEKFKNHLADKYNEYYQLMYNTKMTNLSVVQEYLADKKAVLVEYFYGDSAIYVMTIDPEKNGIAFRKIDNKGDLDTLIENFSLKMSGNTNLNEINKDFEEYCYSSHQLYKTLIGPSLTTLDKDNSRIILVPDGKLSFLPFEAFLTQKANPLHVDYKNLHYLINERQLSYSFSSRVLLRDKSLPTSEKVLIFDYGNEANIKGSKYNLRGGYEESSHVASIFSSTPFSGGDATKSNFLNHVEDAGIIHLALHGKGSKNSASLGAVQFWGEESDFENTFMFYHELTALSLKARLAVLSACETGIGEVKKGEGVFNIARAFRYAGCPSLIASMWRINDRSTSLIIKKFYDDLKSAKELDVALQNGKLAFIKNADEITAHPRYWAGVLLIGEIDSIHFEDHNKHNSFILFLVMVLTLPCVLFFCFRLVSK